MLTVGLLVVGKQLLVAGDDVDDAELEVVFLQEKVLMLGMDVDELLPELSDDVQGDRCVVDEGAAFPGGGEFAPEDAVGGIVVDVVLREEVFELVAAEVEACLDDAAVGALLDGLGVGALAE